VKPAAAGVTNREAWLNRDLKLNLSSLVAVGNYLYGLGPSKDFVCIDRSTGERKWSQSGFGDVASTIASGQRLLVLTDLGEVRLLAANPEKYEELGRLQVCGKTFSHPAWSDGVLYVRDPRELQALQLTKAGR
jgi:outer membrane protein assembly factor BamB